MKIKALKRDIKNKPKSIRKSGGVPAVLYGHKIDNLNLTLDGKAFSRVYRTAGEATVLKLEVDGEKAERNVLVHDVVFDPVSGALTHADLYQVHMDEKIRAHIPLVFEGESQAVKAGNGVLVKTIYELEIEALPADLPREIKVNISKLAAFDDVITVADLKISDKVKLIAEPSAVVVKVASPRAEEEAEAAAPTMSVEDVKVETEEKKKEREAAKAQTAKEE